MVRLQPHRSKLPRSGLRLKLPPPRCSLLSVVLPKVLRLLRGIPRCWVVPLGGVVPAWWHVHLHLHVGVHLGVLRMLRVHVLLSSPTTLLLLRPPPPSPTALASATPTTGIAAPTATAWGGLSRSEVFVADFSVLLPLGFELPLVRGFLHGTKRDERGFQGNILNQDNRIPAGQIPGG